MRMPQLMMPAEAEHGPARQRQKCQLSGTIEILVPFTSSNVSKPSMSRDIPVSAPLAAGSRPGATGRRPIARRRARRRSEGALATRVDRLGSLRARYRRSRTRGPSAQSGTEYEPPHCLRRVRLGVASSIRTRHYPSASILSTRQCEEADPQAGQPTRRALR